MRRNLGLVFITLGAFLLVSALLIRFYAYPKLAVAPIDQNSVTRLAAKDATVFSISDLKEIQTDLDVAATTRGVVDASEEAGGKTRVWAGTTTVRTSAGDILTQNASLTAFDGFTAEAVDCCGNFEETTEGDREEVSRRGLVMKFPFNTQKKTYKVWDTTLGEAVDAEYIEETEIQGLPVYVFRQEIPRTQVGTREVPASVLGEDGNDAIVAESYYSNTRTYYIEPVTGAPINRVEEQNSTLGYQGEDRVTTTKATIQYTDAQIKSGVDDVKPMAQQLGAVRGIVPIGAAILGLILLALGLFFGRTQDKRA